MAATVATIVAKVEATVSAISTATFTQMPDNAFLADLPQNRYFQVVYQARERMGDFGNRGLSRWQMPIQVQVAYTSGWDPFAQQTVAQSDVRLIVDALIDDANQVTGATLFEAGPAVRVAEAENAAPEGGPEWWIIGVNMRAEWTEDR